MPLFPYLEEELYLTKVSLKPLQETMAMASSLPSSSSSSSSSSPLSKLKLMSLADSEDVVSLPNECALNLNSLKNLQFWNCPRLTSLSQAMRYLTSLEDLYISSCNEFNDEDDGMEWRHLNCLHSLNFRSLQKLESLPAVFSMLPPCKRSSFLTVPNLMTLPKWIGKKA